MNYTLPSLNYSYDSLEPYFDAMTMKIHHTKHHQAYIDNTNALLLHSDLKNISIEDLISNLSDVNIEKKIELQNNAGGHANHSFFWSILKLNTVLKGALKTSIEHNFGSFEKFKKEFEAVAIKHFGSGWIWLIQDHSKLFVASTINQNSPLMGKEISGMSGIPLLCLDVWEHAYYLKYQNRRIDYVRSFWNVVNWDAVSKRFNCN
ncbi:superoxide dismutase [Buchnera aphidicola (Schlechtendalia chinensis)]|uniref:Superoxide dismutase n=1 Tax=Buchnera aphidicola subsp. Schlechtendalia chinensis TaxID=118110 RepID=A0A172WDE1_BUCSC|nr:Fe-Mn family superoxide dismutase [Buchnera aphidicola]ANF16981.1 superoxide dismutase [Buchnera aphidicola (Schlechtendalia chinensis)]